LENDILKYKFKKNIYIFLMLFEKYTRKNAILKMIFKKKCYFDIKKV